MNHPDHTSMIPSPHHCAILSARSRPDIVVVQSLLALPSPDPQAFAWLKDPHEFFAATAKVFVTVSEKAFESSFQSVGLAFSDRKTSAAIP
jgi:hypothetical protein